MGLSTAVMRQSSAAAGRPAAVPQFGVAHQPAVRCTGPRRLQSVTGSRRRDGAGRGHAAHAAPRECILNYWKLGVNETMLGSAGSGLRGDIDVGWAGAGAAYLRGGPPAAAALVLPALCGRFTASLPRPSLPTAADV